MGDDTISNSSVDWNTEDELEIESMGLPSCSNREVAESSRMGASRSNGTSSTMTDRFVEMGFSRDLVTKVLKENGDCTEEDVILAALLKYSAPKEPSQDYMRTPENPGSPDADSNYSDFLLDLSDDDISLNEKNGGPSSSNGSPLSLLTKMGFGIEEATKAIDICGNDTPIEELIQYITAAQFSQDVGAPVQEHGPEGHLSRSSRTESDVPSNDEYTALASLLEMGYEADDALAAIDRCGEETPMEQLIQFIEAARFRNDEDTPPQEPICGRLNNLLKRKQTCSTSGSRKKKNPTDNHHKHQRTEDQEDDIIHLPNPMIGFGVPNQPLRGFPRILEDDVVGPPFFYYENVAYTPKGVWPRIKRILYDIEPEFVDSKFFCAANRKRGYLHNLPINNRFQLLPILPATIQEAIPTSQRWWPSWDKRQKLNCLVTCVGSAKLTQRIKEKLEEYSKNNKEPPKHIKDYIIQECKRWNLIWVGKNKVAPLSPDEMEELMGFPKNHTRGGGISTTDRHKFLGNSFQVHTVAYHLSVLKNIYPKGINVLSLFTGIGGAEVALHRLGVPLKNVVSVERSKHCRDIVRSWWNETEQPGNLIHIDDVEKVNDVMVEEWISKFSGFDLVIGGSPCNNLAGGNRVSRNGLEGDQSALFYEYYRILHQVRVIMWHRQ